MISKANQEIALADLRQVRRSLDAAFAGINDLSSSLAFSSEVASYDGVIEETSQQIARIGVDLGVLLRRVEQEENEPDE